MSTCLKLTKKDQFKVTNALYWRDFLTYLRAFWNVTLPLFTQTWQQSSLCVCLYVIIYIYMYCSIHDQSPTLSNVNTYT